jgi:membrane-associated phospholipid phosphatase
VASAGAVVAADLMKRAGGEQPIQALPPVAHFPSGHVAFAAAVFGMAAALAAAGRHTIAAACCAVPVVAIGPAVLILGGHVASDVAGAYGLAAAWILVCLVVVERAHRASWWP